MITKLDAILSLCPGAQVSIDDVQVIWHDPLTAPVTDAEIEAEFVCLQAEATVKAQAKVNARQSALNKLMALGLTEEEALALGVK